MLVRDKDIADQIMRLSKHYNDNIGTRFLRPAFTNILTNINVTHIDDLTEHSEDFIMQGSHLEDLYAQILAMAKFIFLVRRDILPNLHSLTELNTRFASADRVYRTMAFNNLPANLRILADQLADLYASVSAYDRKHSKKGKTVGSKFAELDRIGQMIHF